MAQYRMIDTKRADDVYVEFERLTTEDHDSDPLDYLFQDEDYREQDQARLGAFRTGEWSMIGIQARAHVTVVRNGVGTMYSLTSPGLYSIESDSDESYLQEVFEEEKAILLADIKAIGTVTE